MSIKILLLFLVILCVCYSMKEGLTMDTTEDTKEDTSVQQHFKTLMSEFNTIFPTRNRNAGGPQFYHHIYSYKENLTKELFLLHNTFYCGVSGSPVDPGRGKVYDYVKMNHVDGRIFVGKYYRCCWPCLADIMAHAKVEHHTIPLNDGPFEHMVITIDDPCRKQDQLPDEVNSYKCENKITKNGIRTNSGRLIIAILHGHELYDPDSHDEILLPILELCEERMNTPVEQLRGGMGDIFVKIANI